jgi:hypothetical protein
MLEQIEAGEGNLSMTMKGLDEPTRRVSAAANRLVLAILAAAFIIGPALLIPHLNQIWPDWRAGGILLIAGGFGMSTLLTLVILFSIWRSGR